MRNCPRQQENLSKGEGERANCKREIKRGQVKCYYFAYYAEALFILCGVFSAE